MKTVTSKHLYITLLCILFSLQSLQSQGWVRAYGALTKGNTVYQLQDGGFIFQGIEVLPNRIYLVRTDITGDVIWKKYFPMWQDFSAAYKTLVPVDNDGFALVTTVSNGQFHNISMYRLDNFGNVVWADTLISAYSEFPYSIQSTNDHGFIISGTSRDTITNNTDILLLKTDSVGNVIWRKNYGGTLPDIGYYVSQTPDNGYIIGGGINYLNSYTCKMFVMKTDVAGDTMWTKVIGDTLHSATNMISPTSDGGYILGGSIIDSFYTKMFVAKLDSTGDTVWTLKHTILGATSCSAVRETNDGSFIATGFDSDYNWTVPSAILVAKINAPGSIQWAKRFDQNGWDFGYDIRQSQDGGYIAIGTTESSFAEDSIALIAIKMDSLGRAYSNLITGTVFDDVNQNCIPNIGESSIRMACIEATNVYSTQTLYSYSDSNGRYAILVDTGTYTVRVSPAYRWYQYISTCIPPPITFNSFYNFDTLDLPARISPCPLLSVEIEATSLRRCDSAIYMVRYQNHGLATANNVGLWVELDENLHVYYTSEPIVAVNGDSIYFTLGNTPPYAYWHVTIGVVLDSSCNNTILGQSHCVAAYISPDTSCIHPPGWDGSDIEIRGSCDQDSVRFKIKNKGNGPMLSPATYLVIEDNLIFRNDSYQLAVNDSFELAFYATGKTFRCQVFLTPNHPWGLSVSSTIEGCKDTASTFSIGYLTQYNTDNPSPFVAVSCKTNVNSFDPNEKVAMPLGYGTNHYINPEENIDYTIHFQNTGTDTAFRVMLLDTLSPLLDPGSVVMGAGSHPYTWELLHNGILKILFENIMLPDSNVNEAASHGFIKFHIQQKSNNPPGSVIYNDAAIYFDFNPPIITNETFHTIGENFILLSLSETTDNQITRNIRVIPNPFSESALIEISGEDGENLELEIFDMMGRKLKSILNTNPRQFQIQRGDLPAGIYVFRILQNGRFIGNGKMIVR